MNENDNNHIDGIGGDVLEFFQPVTDPKIHIHSAPGTDGILFTIGADGTIERGPMFTTQDEMSLEFWRRIETAFPRFFSQN